MNYSFAKPLDLDDEHEVIRWVDQERDESFVMSAESAACAITWLGQRARLDGVDIRWVDQDSRVHESRQLFLRRRAQAGKVLPRRVVEVPAVHVSETVLRSDLLPASAF